MSNPVVRVRARFANGDTFESLGEVVFHDRYVVIYDVDGATGTLFYGNLLWMLTETEEAPKQYEPPAIQAYEPPF